MRILFISLGFILLMISLSNPYYLNEKKRLQYCEDNFFYALANCL